MIITAVIGGLCTALAGAGSSWAGRMGQWTLQSKGGAKAQTLPDFRPVSGDILHLKSEAASTATAESKELDLAIPYQVSCWIYVTDKRYDDLVVYGANDQEGQPTDITVMFREDPGKLPVSPEDWHGLVWVQDGKECHSVSYLRRPGWHRLAVSRKSEGEVALLINGEEVGTYPARSPKPARRLRLGDFSAADGYGEAYWGEVTTTSGEGAGNKEVALGGWQLSATGGGAAEQGGECEEARCVHLYLESGPQSSSEAVWGTVTVGVPYQFWCQVYVSEQPYHEFNLVLPLDREGKPTDLQVILDDGDGGSPAASAESKKASVWVVDEKGRRQVGSLTRGVWHEVMMQRRKLTQVGLLLDGMPVDNFVSPSSNPVASYRFGNMEPEAAAGEAYWYRIRLVQVPRD